MNIWFVIYLKLILYMVNLPSHITQRALSEFSSFMIINCLNNWSINLVRGGYYFIIFRILLMMILFNGI